MKVILTTNIKKLGKIGETVKVKNGYARNFLLPNNMALRETKKNLEYYENIKQEIQGNEKIKHDNAKKILDGIAKLKITFKKEADEKGQLFGSISKKEIIDFLNDKKIKINSDDLTMKNNIKSIGEHVITINPYMDLVEEIKIFVEKN